MDNIKTAAQELWREFELLAFIAVKSELGEVEFIEEELTEEIKDGGYDGKFIYLSNNEIVKTLFEAKLRSNVKADLPLDDFAKALVIAVTRHADNLYIVTNLHFSDETIKRLCTFSEYSELDIWLYNGYSVNKFIKEKRTFLKEVSEKLLNYLLSTNAVTYPQTVCSKEENFVPPILDKTLISEFDLQIKAFYSGNKKLLVFGSTHMGKSYYIHQLFSYFKSKNINIHMIDVSKCLTYKQFFIELLEKTFGLSFELVDLLDHDSFDEAFKEIGGYTLSKSDLQTLKFIFSKQDTIEYDYSVVISKMSCLFFNLFFKLNRKRKFIMAFLNLSLSEKEVLRLLLYLLNNNNFSCILEINETEYRKNNAKDWEYYKDQFLTLDNILNPSVRISDWDFELQKRFLQNKIPDLSNEQYHALIKKFGKTPYDLSELVELMNYSNFYTGTPAELIFQDIMKLDADSGNALEIECLKYLQIQNSYIRYIYAFLILFNGKVKRDFVENFKKDINWGDTCYIFLNRSNLFDITMEFICLTASKTLPCLKQFFDSTAQFHIMEEVICYVKEYSCRLSFPKESLLELQVNMTYYTDQSLCVSLLIQLGDSYLKCEQIRKAYETFKLADKLIWDNELEIPNIQQFQIIVGLLKTSVWNTKKYKCQIEKWIKSGENIITFLTENDPSFLLLKLDFYLLCYQFYHSSDNVSEALKSADAGVNLVETYDLYRYDILNCGKAWRFYAIAVKEDTKSIIECLKIFDMAKEKCEASAKFMFGYIIHKNMNIEEKDFKKRLQMKLDNYKVLDKVSKSLSIDEYLHYKTNVAALHFNLKHYDEAWKLYQELLQKSAIFEITREEIRILNDMANIEWIRGKIDDADIKYARAVKIAQNAGYDRNYWPVLVNYMSLMVSRHNYKGALQKYHTLKPYMEEVCINLSKKENSPEEAEYCRAALIIYLHNLQKISHIVNSTDLLKEMHDIEDISYKNEGADEIDMEKILKDTMYMHQRFDGEFLYLLKD